MRLRILLALAGLLVLAAAPSASAQSGRWEALTSMRRAQALAASADALWVGTAGGLYRYDPATGEIERFTTVEGLHGVDVRALAYDARREALWVGYADGVVDRVDAASGAVANFFEIARATRFASRGVNRIGVLGDSLFVSTEFGVVVFDAAEGEVRDTFQRFGTLPGGTAVHDVLRAPTPEGAAGLWVATARGVAWAPAASPNLQEPGAWTVEAEGPSPALALTFFGGHLWAGREQAGGERGDLHRRNPDGSWTMMGYTDRSVRGLVEAGERVLVETPFFLGQLSAAGLGRTRTREGLFLEGAALGPDGRVWIADQLVGLALLPEVAETGEITVEPEREIIPDGPLSNRISALDVGPEGEVWIALRSEFRSSGFARYDGTAWLNVSEETGHAVPSATYTAIHAGPGQAWAGTEGRGAVLWRPEAPPTAFDETNSTLQSATGFPGYTVVGDVALDASGRAWLSNRFSPVPLHVHTPEGEWLEVQRPSGLPSSVNLGRLYFDSFGQLWISVELGNRGFAVLDPGAGAAEAERFLYVPGVGSGGSGLPHEAVHAFAEDRSGRMWFGTERGLAVLYAPGSVFAGSQGLAQPQWARTPDGASYFLRDLRILDIAVDPADRKWLASSDGVWLLNSAGNEVLEHFTPENSPLPSHEVLAVEVEPASGLVYFVTSSGLFRYRSDAIEAAPRAQDLFVFPNPFRPEEHAGGVQIRGLVDATELRILTVDGQVVARFETRGGSARWDGRDERTGAAVPSGVYVVAARGRKGEGTAYGKVAVIR